MALLLVGEALALRWWLEREAAAAGWCCLWRWLVALKAGGAGAGAG
jgi:hypothetical protein